MFMYSVNFWQNWIVFSTFYLIRDWVKISTPWKFQCVKDELNLTGVFSKNHKFSQECRIFSFLVRMCTAHNIFYFHFKRNNKLAPLLDCFIKWVHSYLNHIILYSVSQREVTIATVKHKICPQSLFRQLLKNLCFCPFFSNIDYTLYMRM